MSSWSEPTLGKERVPERSKSLTTGSRQQAVDTPNYKCPSRAGVGAGPQGAAWARGPVVSPVRGPCARPEGSEQPAQPVLLLPLRFLQGAEGHLGGLPEDVLHVLPKFGGTFQIEGSSDLFRDAQALVGGGASIR